MEVASNDQDRAAGSEAKNSQGAHSMELAGLVAKETSGRDSNQAEEVSDRQHTCHGWGIHR